MRTHDPKRKCFGEVGRKVKVGLEQGDFVSGRWSAMHSFPMVVHSPFETVYFLEVISIRFRYVRDAG